MPLLFLIADTGGGHRASANAVARQLGMAHPGDYNCHIVDPFAQASPWLIGRTADLYGPIIRHAPWFWGALYHSTDSPRAVALLRALALRTVEPGIGRLLASLEPAAVVSFHPLLNHVAGRALKRAGIRRVPLITVITDLVDVHASWACPSADAIVTPSPHGHRACLAAGIPAGRCFQLGLPVDGGFIDTPARAEEDRVQLRRRLDIDAHGFTVVLCGGADGSGGLVDRARALAAADVDVQLVVICGRNRAAMRALSQIRDHRGRPLAVRGFVDNMPDWLRAADLIVTKAGPGTIAEALCSGVPMLLSSYLPGQEKGNVGWVEETGAGKYVPKVEDMVHAVRELAIDGSPAYASMREAVRRAARPEATAEIANLVVRFAHAPG
ncbi:MAG: glycosyltransferase [Candidatus Dormibacteria bacterium]